MAEEFSLRVSSTFPWQWLHQITVFAVFMFPQRSVDEVGPIFWSPQLLSFAGVCNFSSWKLKSILLTDKVLFAKW
jgi:hypothetical protein